MNNRDCKGCSSSVHLSDGDIYEIMNNVKNNQKEDIVDENIYKERLAICKECQDLLYNTTCRYSGYIVYMIAKDKDACCYRPGKGKW